MKNLVKIAGAAAMLMASSQAYAQTATGDVPFSGDVLNTCTIDGINAGTLGASAGNTVLSSTAGTGAASGSANVTTNSTIFDISADAPTAFGVASPAVTGVTFAASYDIGGGSVAGTTATDLPNGVTAVTVDMSATASAPLPTGAYSAIVVLRCE